MCIIIILYETAGHKSTTRNNTACIFILQCQFVLCRWRQCCPAPRKRSYKAWTPSIPTSWSTCTFLARSALLGGFDPGDAHISHRSHTFCHSVVLSTRFKVLQVSLHNLCFPLGVTLAYILTQHKASST